VEVARTESGLVTPIESDIVAEAGRLLGRAAEQDVHVRLIGGLAVRLHSAGGVHPLLERDFRDIDFVSPKAQAKVVSAFFEQMGYEPNKVFNTMNTGRRQLFFDSEHGRRIDVFLGSFEMCHPIPLESRLAIDPVTIPLAELLLTKLQIVQLNDKDLRDILSLLAEHEVGDGDEEMINSGQIARLCASDWGLWRTCQLNFERIRSAIASYGFSPEERELLSARLSALVERIEAEPKSRSWKLRARIGDRKRWYQEPEEVA
jgi:hypothetical protein